MKKTKNGVTIIDLTIDNHRKDEDVIEIVNTVTCGASIKKVGKACGSGEKKTEEKTQIKTKTETKIINLKSVIVRTESWVVDGVEIIEIYHDDVLGRACFERFDSQNDKKLKLYYFS